MKLDFFLLGILLEIKQQHGKKLSCSIDVAKGYRDFYRILDEKTPTGAHYFRLDDNTLRRHEQLKKDPLKVKLQGKEIPNLLAKLKSGNLQ